ncbi:hypothetical protein THAOC_31368 [Thalassiosira oceanica]|uniref:YchJ-like middle NTF2-like domain-containing protein n=1 Tax=Thalassiosira oceanica TaxID=159749 RepID=K0RBW3_THAOC|nr:hypothetical protein THAOC_31368 [Thalassiosira oceanica]|eukprot:EJK49724.1 hypothetical protein THAOC_31368 [Thalassiosira oceanica]
MTSTFFLCVVAVLVVVTNAEPSTTFVDSRARTPLPSTSTPKHTLLFAKKKKKKGNRTAQTTKGFGAPPPTLEERLTSFKSRIPEDDSALCACDSGRPYTEYSAFSYRIVDYVMESTHESCRDWRQDKVAWANDLDRSGMFDSFDFVKLEHGDEEMDEFDENKGYIDFEVTLRAKDDRLDSLAGQETVISERSTFLRNPDDMTWAYASGVVRSNVVGLENTSLNS